MSGLRTKRGFGLIELALVLIFIALMATMTAGVREMVHSAETSAYLAEASYLKNSQSGFITRFRARAGDMNPLAMIETFSGNASKDCGNTKFGNNKVDNITEANLAFNQLEQAGLLNQGINFDPCPGAIISANMKIRPDSDAADNAAYTFLSDIVSELFGGSNESYHYMNVIRIGGQAFVGDGDLTLPIIPTDIAQSLDIKSDTADTPTTGTFFVGAECIDTATGTYKSNDAKCLAYFSETVPTVIVGSGGFNNSGSSSSGGSSSGSTSGGDTSSSSSSSSGGSSSSSSGGDTSSSSSSSSGGGDEEPEDELTCPKGYVLKDKLCVSEVGCDTGDIGYENSGSKESKIELEEKIEVQKQEQEATAKELSKIDTKAGLLDLFLAEDKQEVVVKGSDPLAGKTEECRRYVDKIVSMQIGMTVSQALEAGYTSEKLYQLLGVRNLDDITAKIEVCKATQAEDKNDIIINKNISVKHIANISLECRRVLENDFTSKYKLSLKDLLNSSDDGLRAIFAKYNINFSLILNSNIECKKDREEILQQILGGGDSSSSSGSSSSSSSGSGSSSGGGEEEGGGSSSSGADSEGGSSSSSGSGDDTSENGSSSSGSGGDEQEQGSSSSGGETGGGSSSGGTIPDKQDCMVCPGGYAFNEKMECVKEPSCPENFEMKEGVCVSKIGDKCIDPQKLFSGRCVNACPSGYTNELGICVKIEQAICARYFSLQQDGTCKQTSCPSGYSFEAGVCKPFEASKCDKYQEMLPDGRCKQVSCPEGAILELGLCVKEQEKQCEDGFVMDKYGVCTRDVSYKDCPKGYTYDGHAACVQVKTTPVGKNIQ